MFHGLLLTAALGTPAANSDLAQALATVRAAGPNGQGAAAAAAAWKRLAAADVADLPTLLAGMDGASPVARNLIRAAIDPVLDRAAHDKKPVPASELEVFLRDPRHDPAGRRFAYELVVKAESAAADRLLPGLLDDPSPDLRRDAVARVLTRADGLAKDDKKDEAKSEYNRALAAARDFDQIAGIIRKLGELGQKVTLAEHAGFLRSWKVIGPFPNPDEKGIDTAFPPERGLDFAAEYDGKVGPVKWKEFATPAENGLVNLNDAVGDHPEAVAYATTEFRSKEARDAEVRLGSFVAFKLWVNGEMVLFRGDAFTGMKPDHYVAKVKLKPGANTILVKFAQDVPPPQLKPMNYWRFMLRVCDSTGAAIRPA